MKGQYLTLEYVLFFTIGITLVVLVYGLFTDTNNIVGESLAQNQLDSVANMIVGATVNVFEISQQTNSTIQYKLKIPTQVSDCAYSIFLSSSKDLLVECITDRSMTSEAYLYNFNITMKNILYSTRGSLTILARGGKVEIL